MILKSLFVGDIGEETLHGHLSGLLVTEFFLVSRNILGKHLEIAAHLVVMVGEETLHDGIEVSPDRFLCVSIGLL